MRSVEAEAVGVRDARDRSATQVAEHALVTLSSAFHSQDLDALLGVFARNGVEATYAGSEAHETATGADELRALLGDVLARPCRYRFAFPDIRARRAGDIVYVVAEGSGYESSPGRDAADPGPSGTDACGDEFPYRISGVLLAEDGDWRWLLLSGSEPIPTAS